MRVQHRWICCGKTGLVYIDNAIAPAGDRVCTSTNIAARLLRLRRWRRRIALPVARPIAAAALHAFIPRLAFGASFTLDFPDLLLEQRAFLLADPAGEHLFADKREHGVPALMMMTIGCLLRRRGWSLRIGLRKGSAGAECGGQPSRNQCCFQVHDVHPSMRFAMP